MIIKAPEKKDIPALRQLWKDAFGDTDAFLDKFFSFGFSADRCKVLFVDGVAAAVLYWFDCLWNGEKVAYLYAVATDKAYQNQGLCRELMTDTHRHLKNLGYKGAALVPGNQGLFSLYQKFGYRCFCPMETKKVSCKNANLSLRTIDASTYSALRKDYLPENAILQEGVTLTFLSTFAKFYKGENCLFSAYQEDNTLHICEYFGKEENLASIGIAKQALVHLPGGNIPSAMYLDFAGDSRLPDYLGITLN